MNITIIKPKKNISLDNFKEIWQYHELLYFLTWRDLKVRYKQTIIGVLWVILQPFLTMVVFTVFFGRLAKIPSDGIPYPIFVYIGLLFWQLFSSALSEASSSMVDNQSIITKIYFPKIILPLSAVLTKFVDFLVATLVLIGMMFYYHYLPSLSIIFIMPILLIITFVSSAGLGLLLASINVKYRDVRYALPFFIQSLLFITPVIYPISIAGKYAWLLAINPMSGVISTARVLLTGDLIIDWPLLAISISSSLILLVISLIYFNKSESYFADII